MHDLTGFRRDIVVVIAGLDAPHGLAIQAELEQYYEGTVDHGRLYPNLDALVNHDLVEKSPRDERSNEYRLTASGERSLNEHQCWVAEHFDTAGDSDE